MPFLTQNLHMTLDQELELFKSWSDEQICSLVATRTRGIRKEAGLTQEALAALANVPLRTYKRFEANGHANLETFIRILRALNRAHYLLLLLPGPKPRVGSAYGEKISKARARWQLPGGR